MEKQILIRKLINNYRLNDVEAKSFSKDDILKAQQGDEKCLSIILKNNIGIVYNLATKYYNIKEYNLEELLHYCMNELIKSVYKYNISSNCKFSTFAYKCIETSLLYLYKISKSHSYFEVCYGEMSKKEKCYIENRQQDSNLPLDSIVFNKDFKNTTYELFKEILNDKQFNILSLKYGLFDNRVHTYQELADQYNCSINYIYIVVKQAQKRIIKHKSEFVKKLDLEITD